ncbi:MAG TPA: hypothetical protein VGD66_01655 [Allosphingosinicella sp.]|jgi:tetratricopeptide (TPR) repeat protein
MSAMALAVLLSVGSPAPAAAAAEPSAPIVVTGIRLGDARQQLEQCLARKCPPLEDIKATLQYAEALFTAGNYDEASAVLQRSVGRNHGHADRYPVGVAGLYRALGRVSMHQGEGDRARSAAYGVVRSLQAGLPAEDARILGGKLEAADTQASLGDGDGADRLYREVADKARRIGRPDLAATAEVRRGLLLHRLGYSDGRALLEKVAALADPRTRTQQLAARVVLARIDRDAGKADSTQRLLAELRAFGLRKPALVYAPPIDVPRAGTMAFAPAGGDGMPKRGVASMTPTEGFDYWADVGFWITPEGRVQEAEILRAKGPREWLQPVLSSIAGRIYAPAAGAAEATYRVERFSYTSLMETQTGTRIATHSAQGRIESLDITAEAPPPPRQD